MKKLLLLLYGVHFLFPAQGQEILREMLYKINGNKHSNESSTSTREGNIMFSGVNGTLDKGYLIQNTLTNSKGDTLWVRNGPLVASGRQKIIQTADGGFIIPSTTWQGAVPTNKTDLLLQKFDANGFPTWSKTYDGQDHDMGLLVLQAPDGGYFLGGDGGIPNKQTECSLLRTDSLGNVLWRRNYDWSGRDWLVNMTYTPEGNIILVGITYDKQFNNFIKLLVINQQGDSLRGLSVPKTNASIQEYMALVAGNIMPITGGGFVITAESDSLVDIQALLLKVDANLKPVWRYKQQTGSVMERLFTKVLELTDGSMVVLATNYAAMNNHFYLYHISKAGELIKVYTFTTTLGERVYVTTLNALADSTFLVGGNCENPSLGTGGLYLAKIKVNGLPPAGPPDTTTHKPGPPHQSGPLLSQSYPNPTKAHATVTYNLPEGTTAAEVRVYDLTGRRVRRYVLATTNREGVLVMDLRQLSGGLYGYTLIANGKPVATRKLAVVK